MDYKEAASVDASELLEHALLAIRVPGLPYTKRRAISVTLRSMPDAYSCPRAFAAWNQTPLRKAIAAAAPQYAI